MTISKEIKVGLIVTGAIVAAIWGINYLNGRDLFSSSKEYFVIYDQVNGLAKSNLVKLNGYKVGQVEKISFTPDNSGHILINFAISSSVFVSEDATAVIAIVQNVFGQMRKDAMAFNLSPAIPLINQSEVDLTDKIKKLSK